MTKINEICDQQQSKDDPGVSKIRNTDVHNDKQLVYF